MKHEREARNGRIWEGERENYVVNENNKLGIKKHIWMCNENELHNSTKTNSGPFRNIAPQTGICTKNLKKAG